MNSKTIEQIVIESMEPTFEELIGSSKYFYEDYSRHLSALNWLTSEDGFVWELQYLLSNYFSNAGAYNAACDVASTLEVLCPEKYTGKFTY